MIKYISSQNLNELYIGNSPILPLQNQLSIIRSKFKNKPFSNSTNVDKDILKFNRLVEKLFGYESFALNICPDQTINAYAWPIYAFRSKDEIRKMMNSLKAAKTGFKHDPTNGKISAICTLNLGLINYDEITDEEIMAVLLHEIGHTFFQAVTDKDCVYTLVSRIIETIYAVNSKIVNRISDAKPITQKDIENDVITSISYATISDDLINVFSKVKNTVFNLPHSISSTAKKVLSTVSSKFFKESMEDNMRKTRYAYTNEKFADSFAVMYGYGVPLQQFLLKIDDYYIKELDIHQSRNSVIIAYKVFKYMLFDSLAYITNLMDEHPKDLARIKVSIEYLKRELSRESLDPKMKLELMRQIEDLNKLIEDYINFPKDEDNIAIRRAYYRELYKRFGGDRREQDTDNDALFRRIDKRYEELNKK